MKRIIYIIILASLFSALHAEEREALPFVVMEYNCENLFDTQHDSLKRDYDFTPEGSHKWTFSRLWRKLNNIGRVVVEAAGDVEHWHMPDLVAMVEVENDSVMRMLTKASMLREAGYRYVMTNSEDVRGVDVALMYNPLTFKVINKRDVRIVPEQGQRPTRDVLYVSGVARGGDTLHVVVVHAPSRLGGQAVTEPYRLRVADTINAVIDSVRLASHDAHVIVTGDFNDYFYDRSIRAIEAHDMADVSAHARGERALGTYKFQGEWESLDHILLSSSLQQCMSSCRILDPLWLLKSTGRGEYSPRRTYLGNFYQGGVSDHLPLLLHLALPNNF